MRSLNRSEIVRPLRFQVQPPIPPQFLYSFFIIKHIIHDIYNGSILRYLHSNEASFTFLITYSHIIRSIILQSYIYLFNTWITGIILYLILIVIAFLRYILPWGQMSYWGSTVITNVLSFIPDIVEWICGNFFIYNPTLNRFFISNYLFITSNCFSSNGSCLKDL